jgi:hypothetical protein
VTRVIAGRDFFLLKVKKKSPVYRISAVFRAFSGRLTIQSSNRADGMDRAANRVVGQVAERRALEQIAFRWNQLNA